MEAVSKRSLVSRCKSPRTCSVSIFNLPWTFFQLTLDFFQLTLDFFQPPLEFKMGLKKVQHELKNAD